MDGDMAMRRTAGVVDRWLKTAVELYDQVEFKTDVLFNRPAPGYKYSFIVGGVS
jgi:hypothetical protein